MVLRRLYLSNYLNKNPNFLLWLLACSSDSYPRALPLGLHSATWEQQDSRTETLGCGPGIRVLTMPPGGSALIWAWRWLICSRFHSLFGKDKHAFLIISDTSRRPHRILFESYYVSPKVCKTEFTHWICVWENLKHERWSGYLFWQWNERKERWLTSLGKSVLPGVKEEKDAIPLGQVVSP